MKTKLFSTSHAASPLSFEAHGWHHRKPKLGFTLVEMLVSMAILGMIVLLMGRIFADGSSAYKQGMKSSDQNLNGRVIMDYIARELRQAITDENLVMRVSKSPDDPYGTGLNDWISFASLGGGGFEGEKKREVELLRYYVKRYEANIGGVDVQTYALMRGINTDEDIINKAYKDPGWARDKGEAQQMARNLSGFAIKIYADENGDGEIECVRDIGEEYQSDELPAYADIYMGLLGDSDLVEATISQDPDLIANKEMIFMKRVYFRNRMGYNTAYGRDLWNQ